MKYVSIDIETTGLDVDTCQTIEVGAVIDDLKNPQPLEYLPTFHCYVERPVYQGEPYALHMHSEIFRRIAERESGFLILDPSEVEDSLYRWLAENGFNNSQGSVHIIPAGKNFGSFDRQFLCRELGFGNKVRMAHRSIDPAILFFDPESDRRLPSLGLCLERAGLDSVVQHTAVEDALQVVQLLRWHYGVDKEA